MNIIPIVLSGKDLLTMSIHIRKYITTFITCSMLSISASNIFAQPVGNNILTGATAIQYAGCKEIEIAFSIPFRYLSHYPTHEGKVLRIQLLPLSENGDYRESRSDNESIRVMSRDIETGIKEIIYEKAYSSQRPFLDIHFDHNVYFTVKSGTSFRSVIVIVSDTKDLKCLE